MNSENRRERKKALVSELGPCHGPRTPGCCDCARTCNVGERCNHDLDLALAVRDVEHASQEHNQNDEQSRFACDNKDTKRKHSEQNMSGEWNQERSHRPQQHRNKRKKKKETDPIRSIHVPAAWAGRWVGAARCAWSRQVAPPPPRSRTTPPRSRAPFAGLRWARSARGCSP